MRSSVVLPESERTVLTYVYFTNQHKEEWKKACDYVNRSILFYSEHVGEYPWNIAQAVDGTLEVESAGGMEYPTVTVLGGDHDAEALDNIVTHEVGHNWFYGIIGSNERLHAWMDEGINSFYENRYMDTYYDRENSLGLPEGMLAVLGVDTSDVNEVQYHMYQSMAKQNRAQSINLHSNDYTMINYGLGVYAQSAYIFSYLEDVLGQDEFDRIMRLKENGATILFCSHSIYQIEALCTRALWLEKGVVQLTGDPASVVAGYQAFLDRDAAPAASAPGQPTLHSSPSGHAHILGVQTRVDQTEGTVLYAQSAKQMLAVSIGFASDPELPSPVAAITIHSPDGRTIASSSTQADHLELVRDISGRGTATIEFPNIPLLKGEYYIGVYLLSENGIHVYDTAAQVATLHVVQDHLEQGVVSLPHRWQSEVSALSAADRLAVNLG